MTDEERAKYQYDTQRNLSAAPRSLGERFDAEEKRDARDASPLRVALSAAHKEVEELHRVCETAEQRLDPVCRNGPSVTSGLNQLRTAPVGEGAQVTCAVQDLVSMIRGAHHRLATLLDRLDV